jgi:hypothetical protein
MARMRVGARGGAVSRAAAWVTSEARANTGWEIQSVARDGARRLPLSGADSLLVLATAGERTWPPPATRSPFAPNVAGGTQAKSKCMPMEHVPFDSVTAPRRLQACEEFQPWAKELFLRPPGEGGAQRRMRGRGARDRRLGTTRLHLFCSEPSRQPLSQGERGLSGCRNRVDQVLTVRRPVERAGSAEQAASAGAAAAGGDSLPPISPWPCRR